MERNFHSDHICQKQTSKIRFKYVPFNTHECTDQTEQFTRFFTVKFEEKGKRIINQFALRNEIVRITGIKPRRIHSSDKTSFTIEAQNKSQSSHRTKLDIVEGMSCVTSPHKYYNQCKGIVYLRECDVTDMAEFESGLKKTNII